MSDDVFFKDARNAVASLESEVAKPQRRPWLLILALFIVFIFIFSIIPYYLVNINPHPDFDVVASFSLSNAEKEKLESAEYKGGASLQSAILQINVDDYRMVSSRLVSHACSVHSDLCYAKAVYAYVSSMNYISDPKARQYVQSPAETILAKSGDCEDVSILLATMLESIGIDSDVGVTQNHAFVRAQLPKASFFIRHGEYVWLDATGSEFGQTNFRASDVLDWIEVA